MSHFNTLNTKNTHYTARNMLRQELNMVQLFYLNNYVLYVENKRYKI